jgi:hypothetical protein
MSRPTCCQGIALVFCSLLAALPAAAHHSAPVFYNTDDDPISITGTVAKFNFRNPHAIVELLVTTETGETQRWTCETSAPSALRRRGWSQDVMHEGETVTLWGIHARDGSNLMRITRAIKEDGTEIGVSRNLSD